MSSILCFFDGGSKSDLEPKKLIFLLVGGDANTIAVGELSLLLFNSVMVVVVVVRDDAAANSNCAIIFSLTVQLFFLIPLSSYLFF